MKESEELKNELRRIVRELLLLLSLILIIVAVCLVKEYFDKHYTHFNAERTALMERIFDITVDDNVKLKRYSDESILIAINQRLELETDDYERFIAENVNAALKLDESIGQPYFLNAAFGQHLVGFYLDEFIFYGTASAIKH